MKPVARKWTETDRLFLSVCVGYALCRMCSEMSSMFPLQSFGAGELGKVAGLIAALAIAYSLNRNRENRVWNYAPSVLVVASCLLNAMSLGFESIGVLRIGASFLLGFGTSAAMIQWLEYCGTLPCRKMVVAIAVAYLLSSAVSLLVGLLQNLYLICMLVFACSLGLLCLRHVCERDRDISERLASSRRVIVGMASDLFPFDVLVWIVVTGLAFGLVEQGGDLFLGSTVDTVSRTIPCIIVLVGYSFFNDRFDLRFLYSSILPLIVAALVFTTNGQIGSFVPGVFLSAGAASLRIITYSLVCVRAYQRSVSSFFGSACVMLSNVCSHVAGRSVAALPFVGQNYAIVASLFTVLSVAVIVFLIMSESERMAFVDDLPGFRAAASSNEGELVSLAAQKGLTSRETSVLMQMACGRSNAEIADELFITVGAVRSHTSRIYQKFGIGTRGELDEVVKRLGR